MSEMRDRRDVRDDRDMRNDEVPDEVHDEVPTDDPMQPEKEMPVQQRTDSPMESRIDKTTDTRMDRRPETQMEMWPEMADFRSRFEKLESDFIDDPKAAVENAERLVEEAVERLTSSMRERMKTMHGNIEGKDGDTESLRQAMVRYRDWIESMGGRRAA
jgi:hypothetical protein